MANRTRKDAQYYQLSEKCKLKQWCNINSHLSEYLSPKQSVNIRSFRGYGERNHLNTLGQCKLLVQPLWESVWRFHKNLKIGQPYDPAILLPGTYPEKVKTLTWKDTYTPVSLAILFIISHIWKQLKHLSALLRRYGVHIHIMEYYSDIKMRYYHLQQNGWI